MLRVDQNMNVKKEVNQQLVLFQLTYNPNIDQIACHKIDPIYPPVEPQNRPVYTPLAPRNGSTFHVHSSCFLKWKAQKTYKIVWFREQNFFEMKHTIHKNQKIPHKYEFRAITMKLQFK